MRSATRLDARNPFAEFESDIESKQKLARSLEPDPALAALESLYNRLTPGAI